MAGGKTNYNLLLIADDWQKQVNGETMESNKNNARRVDA